VFDGIRKWWRNGRIDADFPRYEAQARSAHEAGLAKRFPTGALQVERDRLMEPHLRRSEVVFGDPICMVRTAIARIEATIAEIYEQIDVLETDYQALLKPLYDRSRQIGEDWDELMEQKSQAHDDFADAKESIKSWHNKSSRSEIFLGNGGRKLPNHAWFGQSFGDLDGYKSDRASAVDEIRAANEGLDSLSLQRGQVQLEIAKLKEGRARQRNLLAQGLQLPTLRNQLQRTSERHEEQTAVLIRMDMCRRDMLDQGWYRSGAKAVHDAIAQTETAREACLRSFDAEDAKARRRLEHRANFPE